MRRAFRAQVYWQRSHVRFPGKASGGGDRKPDAQEAAAAEKWLAREVAILEPELVSAVGTLAIERVLGGVRGELAEVVGMTRRARGNGRQVDVIALPHTSGASPWHKIGLARR